MKVKNMFQHTSTQFIDTAQSVLALARQKGAGSAEVDVSESLGQSVSVRLQEIEQIEHQQDKSLDITVYFGQRKGRASTADLSLQALEATVQAACDIARYTAEDEYAGLADADLMAKTVGDLDKYHEWNLSSEEAVALAKQCEQAGLEADGRIVNSDGANLSISHYQFVYANTHGFCQHQKGTRHSISCSLVADDGNGMERDYWFDVACRPQDLEGAEHIGRTASQRAVRRLNARSLPTGQYPVVFDTTVAGSLIGHLIGGLSGPSLYRQASFLCDSLGKTILPTHLDLREEPHIPRGLNSSYFDAEGVATHPRSVIEKGVVQGYFLNSYAARKLGMQSTANAGGAHHLILTHTHDTQAALLKDMGSGLLVTELMGQGVNILTGDYSRGAAGFWVEHGVISHPVSGITIAGNLRDMLRHIAGVANDVLYRNSHHIGSIWLEKMTVAGEAS